ncbi:MAG TPA: hypothetical protein VG797_11765 [Phycisphaerales bacterium]|nr:hypothetical protein [Phycisphaerales bacterium]
MKTCVIAAVVGAAFTAGTCFAVEPFRLAAHGFGGSIGQPYRTSDGSGFFIHSSQENEGMAVVDRPAHADFAGDADLEWTTYVSEDPLGPSRRAGGINNAADSFYITRGVYPVGFASRNSAMGVMSWGGSESEMVLRSRQVSESGVFHGDFFIAAAPIVSSVSPEGAGTQGIFLARLTVQRGVTITGLPDIILASGPFQDGLFHPTLNGELDHGFGLRSYLVAQTTILDTGVGGETPFGDADVYDVWVVSMGAVPAPGALAMIGAGAPLVWRRRRASVG